MIKNDQKIKDLLINKMVELYGASPSKIKFARCPYRVCPIGAHIDHQRGISTAFAIDQYLYLAFVPNENRQVRLASLNYPGEIKIELGASDYPLKKDWGDYARGAVKVLQEQFELSRGIDGVIYGEWSECGLSSSAAVGIAYLLALEYVNGIDIKPRGNIELDRKIENEYLGINNGILDQTAIIRARENRLTFIDCRTGRAFLYEMKPILRPFSILIFFSGIKENILKTHYNKRFAECREAADFILRNIGMSDMFEPVLGEIPEIFFHTAKEFMPETLRKRAEHFYKECARVKEGVKAFKKGALFTFGMLMNQSCESSIHNYECGRAELIDIFDILRSIDGVYGARFAGAGFRGCCVALIDDNYTDKIIEIARKDYLRLYPHLADKIRMAVCKTSSYATIE